MLVVPGESLTINRLISALQQLSKGTGFLSGLKSLWNPAAGKEGSPFLVVGTL